jgi:hypothetical protein
MALREVNQANTSSAVARSLSKADAELSKVSSVRIAVNFPSRYIPLLGLFLAIATIFSSMVLNHYYGSDDSVLLWPYIRCVLKYLFVRLEIFPSETASNSDVAKDAPQAGLFAYGMTVLCQNASSSSFS